MKVIYDEYDKVTWPCSNCAVLEESPDNTCDKEKCIYPRAYCASEEQHKQEGNKMNIPKQPTIPKIPKKSDDILQIIKPCPYLLPCGSCDKRNGELCSQYYGVYMETEKLKGKMYEELS